MTPRQRSAGRLALGALTVIAIPLLTWAAQKYDASKVDVTDFRAYIAVDSARHAFDSLRTRYEYEAIRESQLRTDSAVRKICAVVVGSRC